MYQVEGGAQLCTHWAQTFPSMVLALARKKLGGVIFTSNLGSTGKKIMNYNPALRLL